MNTFLVFSADQEDRRCGTCKHHKYLVLSEGDGMNVLHTHINLVNGNKFPRIERFMGIHWWGLGLIVAKAPECLKSYKIIGGNK